MTQPITPYQVGAAKASVFPPEIFQAFNDLIVAHHVGGYSRFTQREAVEAIVESMITETPYGDNGAEIEQRVYEKGWLNVDDAYRAAGWIVEYDKPGYNESYPATFVFRKP